MLSLFFLLLFCQPILGSHFDDGSIRWVPISKNATVSPVQVLITQSYLYTLSLVNCTVGLILGNPGYGSTFNLSCTNNCGATSAGYVPPTILGYCTGFNSALNLAFVQRSDVVNLTVNDHFSVSFTVASNATSGFYRSLTLINGTNLTTAHWNITAIIDIRPRTDNGLINTPPSATVISPYGIPYNVTTQIIIPTMDVDGDDVRCRWSNSSAECGSVCYPLTTPIGTTLSSDCILTIKCTSATGWYCVSIQVEDFLNTSTSLPPMSSTPIQFLVYVYKQKNCSEPILTSSSTCVGVQVGLPTTITLTVINSCGSSSNISSIAIQSFSGIVQGPLVLITPNKTIYAMNITYTPLASQVGLQILCARALDNTNIPSNQYCITYIVGSTSVPACANTSTQTTSTRTTTSTSSKSSETLQTSLSLAAITDSLTSFQAVQTSKTSTFVEITSMEMETSSLITTQILQITANGTTSQQKIISTTTVSKSNIYNWPLIGSLIALFSLLIILGSCCLCYHLLWSPTSRRRRHQQQQQQQQETQHRFQHHSVNEIDSDLTKIPPPRKANQIFDINVKRRKYSNNTNSNYSQSESSSRSIRIDLIKRSTLDNALSSSSVSSGSISSKSKHDSKKTNSLFNTNQAKSTITVTRISNTARRLSTSNEKKIRQSSSFNVHITRVKK